MSATKEQKNYLSQSFIPIIFFSVKFNYTLWLSYNYGAWEAANYFLWKILKFLAEIQHYFHQSIPYTKSSLFKSQASDDSDWLFKCNMKKKPCCISVTDSTWQLNLKEKEKITQQETNSIGHFFKIQMIANNTTQSKRICLFFSYSLNNLSTGGSSHLIRQTKPWDSRSVNSKFV